MSTAHIVVTGNLTEDPELKTTPGGQNVCNPSVACTPRKFNKQTNEFEDGETLFLRGSCWGAQAERVVDELRKGMRVQVSGQLKARSYTTKDGEKRTVIEIDIDEIGPSLKFASKRQGGQRAPQARTATAASGNADTGADQDPF
jgi:single-strand DNA-binding protein